MTDWKHRGSGEVVILDNRDSFVFNLAHRFWEVGLPTVVAASDRLTLEELVSWEPRALVVSPGPGHPDGAGISVSAIRRLSGVVPILGVCLGHQAIVTAFGGVVDRDECPMHGVASPVAHDGSRLFAGVPSPFAAARYHSLAATLPLPDALKATAKGGSPELVMAVEHCQHPTFGLQFHPESILTPEGFAILRNFAALAG